MSKNQGQRLPYSVSQNFLTSRRTLQRLIRIAGLCKADTVLEIGAGKGHITKLLAHSCKKVISYEIDDRLYTRLKPQLPENVQLHRQDFLRCILPEAPYWVFANIPFSVTTDIVRKLTAGPSLPEGMWLIMEKGAAKRFSGLPKENLSSLLIKPFFETKIVYHFRREDFHPAPRVDTVMLEFRRKKQADLSPEQWDAYVSFLRHSLQYGLFGKKALLRPRQIEAVLKMEGLPQLKPSDDVRYIQWLCLFRFWLRLRSRHI